MFEGQIRPYVATENQAKQFYTIAEKAFQYGSPWTYQQYHDLLNDSDMVFFVAEIDNEIVGYIGGKIVLDEAELYTIAVKRESQKRSVARQLLEAFKEACKQRGVTVLFLEVRLSNMSARRFYEKNEFEIIGVRGDYYSFPKEDALMMKYEFRKKEENNEEANLGD